MNEDYLDDSFDSGDSSSALQSILQTAAQVGTAALVANSSQPIVVQGPNGLISNTPSIMATSSSMLWIIIALAAVVLIVLIR